ncbi:MAG: DUF4159 domain-containing protein [Planctomycetes bacterium]|nr:DUF4159 domain-containing protein [Planctomycetota bacterium]
MVVILSLTAAQPARAAEPLAERVRKSLEKGIQYLTNKQENRGGEINWENAEFVGGLWKGGTSCLATLALLSSGVKANDQVIVKVLPYIRGLKPEQTYILALQTMVLAEVGEARDLNIIQGNVDTLLAGRMYNGKDLTGWSYKKVGQLSSDNSNTQYALLGLLAGRQAGVKIARKDWQEIQDFYKRTQVKTDVKSGGWPYRPDPNTSPSHTMTVAGLCGLFISGLELNVGQQMLDEETGIAKKCGFYEENEAVTMGMNWLAKAFKFHISKEAHPATFYNIYGIERVGRLSGQRFIGKHDWYRAGCERLTGLSKDDRELAQHEDGSWSLSNNGIDNMPVISTSFALLFLSKGRTPILLSKLAFDGDDNSKFDWNRKHNDARHLVEYASLALFKKQPLAWQIFDPRLRDDLDDEAKFKEELANLLQSPILYMNGHAAPKLTPRQVELLRQYIDEGGFIFAEACCGSPEFTAGFHKLMAQVFKNETQLTPVRAEHPVWASHMPLNPKDFIDGKKPEQLIQCIERGCKTVVIFTPQPLAGYWEESRFLPRNNLPPASRGELAFRFAGNVIAYATGLEMPKPRLTKVELTDHTEIKDVTRHALRLAQVRHTGDWHPAPNAMRTLASYLVDHYKLQIAPSEKEIKPSSSEMLQYKFMYMHGRRDFTMDPEELDNIRKNLKTGGTLFADACCGAKEFDKAFRELAKKLYPSDKFERIPPNDFLFSEKLNGKAITTVKCRREKADGSAALEFEDVVPELEGVKINDRWVIIYSKYDIGCALEKSKSSACKGHDHESAKLLGAAAVLYHLKK